ncbi:MAG: hypothetical protein EOP38_01695 [Rubrivivax sp.]|nr:MAG: hypothetical protein EOP38_01695 [Rubrivivax sp.]
MVKAAPGQAVDDMMSIAQGATQIGAGGLTDAGAGVWNLGNDAVKYLSSKLFDHKLEGMALESKIPQPDSTAGKAARGITQFVVPYTGALKFVKALPVLAKAPALVQAMTAGAAVDYAAFEPEEKNAVNVLQDVFQSNPVVHSAYMDYLKASPTDSHAEGRAKQALIGLHLGAATDILMAGMKTAKGLLGPKAADVWTSLGKARALEESAQKTAKVTPVVSPKPVPVQPTLAENVQAMVERRKGSVGKTAAAQRRVDAELTYTDPLNQKKLDQWEKAVAEAEAQKVAPSVAPVVESVDGVLPATVDNTGSFQKFHLDGEHPLIGHADDPMVHELDHDTAEALGVRGAPPTEAQRVALEAHEKLQDEALKALREAVETRGSTRVFSDEARAHLRALAEAHVVAPKVTPAEGAQALLETVRTKDALIARITKALNPDGSLNLPTADRAVTSSGLVQLLHRLDKRQMGSALGTSAATVAGAADADDGQGGEGSNTQSLVMSALAGFAAYKLHGGVKNFLVRKGLQAGHPVADELARLGVEGLTSPVGAVPEVLPKARIDAMTDAAVSGSYRDLSTKVSPGDFNFSRFNTGADVKNMIDAFTGQFTKEFDKSKRGVVSLAQTEEHAKALGVSMDSFKAMHEGTANLDATVTAHRAVFVAHAQHVVEVAKVASETGTDAAILAARQAVARHATIQAYMKSSQTEIARALSAMRIMSGEAHMASTELHTMVEALGGKEANMDFMRRLSELSGDPQALTEVAKRSALARTSDALFESFVGGILSGPSTQVANLIGNTAVALWSGIERQTAVGISKIARRGAGEGVTQAEVNGYVSGMVHGFGASLRVSSAGRAGIAEAAGMFLKGDRDAAMGVLQTNSQEMGGFWTSLLMGEGKAEGQAADLLNPNQFTASPRVPAISSQALHLDSDGYLGQSVDYLGAAIRTPLRLLGAADDAFKSAYYMGELHAQATRDGLGRGLNGKDLYEHIAQFVDSPTREARKAALESASKGTFQSPLGDKLRWASDMQRNLPFARWVLPIIKTPLNVVSYVGERTPMLRTYSDAVKADLEAGGARADIANARLAAGALLYLTGAGLAKSGLFTGGGESDQSAEGLSGPAPYSLKVGDEWIALNRMAPLGMFLGLSADMSALKDHWSEHEAPALVGAAILALSRNISSQTMTAGLSDLVDALNQAQRGNTSRLSQWGNNLTASVVTPFSGMLRTLARDEDPYAKEVWDLADAFKSRLPGYSKDVFNRVDALGNDVKARKGAFPTSQDSEDPAARELRRLNVDLKKLPKGLRVADGMPAIDLTPQQYYRFQKLHGGLFKDALNGAISEPTWKDVPEGKGTLEDYTSQKERIVKMLHQETRKAATSQLYAEFPELQSKMEMVLSGRPM